jgi:hypothetical protein
MALAGDPGFATDGVQEAANRRGSIKLRKSLFDGISYSL